MGGMTKRPKEGSEILEKSGTKLMGVFFTYTQIYSMEESDNIGCCHSLTNIVAYIQWNYDNMQMYKITDEILASHITCVITMLPW